MPYQTDELTAIRWTPCVNVGSAQVPAAAPVQVVGITIVGQSAVYQVTQIGSGSYAAFNLRVAFNGPQPIDAGSYGSCTAGGFVQTLWDTGTPTAGEVWGIKPGQFSLTKGGAGSFIVDGIVDSSSKRMCGRWLGIDTILGKVPSGTFGSGTSGTLNVWIGAAGSEAVTSGPWTVTAYNRKGAFRDQCFRGRQTDQRQLVHLGRRNRLRPVGHAQRRLFQCHVDGHRGEPGGRHSGRGAREQHAQRQQRFWAGGIVGLKVPGGG